MRKLILISFMLSFTTPLLAQEPMLAEVKMFAGTFAPRGWAFCDGQLLPVAQYTALFSLLGTTYGGDGRTTFALPDLRGRAPIHTGQGPGLSPRRQGERGGQETTTLTINEMPVHSHTATVQAYADSTVATKDRPDNALPARNAGSTPIYGQDANTTFQPASVTINNSGSGQPHQNMQPYLVINYIIALQGIYPSRD